MTEALTFSTLPDGNYIAILDPRIKNDIPVVSAVPSNHPDEPTIVIRYTLVGCDFDEEINDVLYDIGIDRYESYKYNANSPKNPAYRQGIALEILKHCEFDMSNGTFGKKDVSNRDVGIPIVLKTKIFTKKNDDGETEEIEYKELNVARHWFTRSTPKMLDRLSELLGGENK